MSLYSTGTVHVYCTHRPVHSRADGPVWCEPRREKHDPWGVNYNQPTDENNTLTCDTTVKNWESISIKTKKHLRSLAEGLLFILQFWVCEPILCRNLQVACRAEKRSSQDRVCSTQPPASIIQPQSYLWKWFSLNIEKLSNTSIIAEL